MSKHVLCLVLCLALGACQGTGFSQFNSGNFWTTEDAEDKAEESWWDHFRGKKPNTPESAAWKEFYAPPDTTNNCAFYGNCKPANSASGW